MSPESFCLEYWSFLVYHVSQPGVRNTIRSSRSDSFMAPAPTMLICLILAISPSTTAKLMPTRLRSSGVMVVVTWTA